MLLRLVVLFIALPLLELALLIQVGQWIGIFWTVALVAVTGILGAALARRQGGMAWLAIQRELREGRMPGSSLLDGLLILIGGIVLLTPGLLTDLLGLALLAPPTRGVVKAWLRRRFDRAIRDGEASFTVLLRP